MLLGGNICVIVRGHLCSSEGPFVFQGGVTCCAIGRVHLFFQKRYGEFVLVKAILYQVRWHGGVWGLFISNQMACWGIGTVYNKLDGMVGYGDCLYYIRWHAGVQGLFIPSQMAWWGMGTVYIKLDGMLGYRDCLYYIRWHGRV